MDGPLSSRFVPRAAEMPRLVLKTTEHDAPFLRVTHFVWHACTDLIRDGCNKERLMYWNFIRDSSARRLCSSPRRQGEYCASQSGASHFVEDPQRGHKRISPALPLPCTSRFRVSSSFGVLVSECLRLLAQLRAIVCEDAH
jgi:hypothetical protein